MNNAFQIERPDWTLFASLETLSQKAGVAVGLLRRLALKELVDNGLDAGATVTITEIRPRHYEISDDGPGIDGSPEAIARLFSINRPLVSAKLWRRPLRGALGNGLRIVAGALIASGGGSLVVSTRGRRLMITPGEDGDSDVIAAPCERTVGTVVEISFGRYLEEDYDATSWAIEAIRMATGGASYVGRPSVWHHDADSFYTLTSGAGDRPVRDFVSGFDGCTGAKAGQIAGQFLNRSCHSVTRDESSALLVAARGVTSNVSHRRLGAVGRIESLPPGYSMKSGEIVLGAREPKALIPFVVEAWAQEAARSHLSVFVNRTPITGDVRAYRDSDKDFVVYGCGLSHVVEGVPKKGTWNLTVNVTTPHMPITSDGKTPALVYFMNEIFDALAAAIRQTKRGRPKSDERVSQKDVFLDHLDEGIEAASGDGAYRFPLRQLFYALRPFVIKELGVEPTYANFEGIIADYENENGEIPGIYRDARGVLSHPHSDEADMPIGTLMVEDYERPPWVYNKILIVEKQGFHEAIKVAGLRDRYDFVPMTNKGFTGRALKDLVDRLAGHAEPLTVMCVHDADCSGTMIYQTLVKKTRARGARTIEIINVGLDPWEAEAMGLASEDVKYDKEQPVADYIREYKPRADGENWADWLQTHRYELNAMTMPQFLAWIEGKIVEHGGAKKVIPPADVVASEIATKIEKWLRQEISDRILREANIDALVERAKREISIPDEKTTGEKIGGWLDENQDEHWRSYLDELVDGAVSKSEPPIGLPKRSANFQTRTGEP